MWQQAWGRAPVLHICCTTVALLQEVVRCHCSAWQQPLTMPLVIAVCLSPAECHNLSQAAQAAHLQRSDMCRVPVRHTHGRADYEQRAPGAHNCGGCHPQLLSTAGLCPSHDCSTLPAEGKKTTLRCVQLMVPHVFLCCNPIRNLTLQTSSAPTNLRPMR